jgi:hypothetical protein
MPVQILSPRFWKDLVPASAAVGKRTCEKSEAPADRSLHGLRLKLGHILGLETLWTGYYIEFYIIAFVQGFESLTLNGTVVYKYVITGIAADETITFFVVKPLNGSLFFHLFS